MFISCLFLTFIVDQNNQTFRNKVCKSIRQKNCTAIVYKMNTQKTG